ncbi:uncharacterized protein PADG_06620 [Paracoccidioides brasiliensis Pb18]|uniref:Uncharacterized protein n=2 Tax=Paracoccidioides brasiliensis TaxID=121759 RepID=C1GH84_PARBD|nr:uncharacterized protein PADG_06620 [Paracoccidioides brasiliensis Pb18]EEH50541.2 hypothetical protein PADG_06620 [Paracoccidioides brasiliensis Pb18]
MAFIPQTKDLASAKAGAGLAPASTNGLCAERKRMQDAHSDAAGRKKRSSRENRMNIDSESVRKKAINSAVTGRHPRTPGVVPSDSLQNFSSKPPIET